MMIMKTVTEISPDLKVLEEKIMALLLDGKHPVLSALREQWKNSAIEEVSFSGCGFFIDYKVPETVSGLSGKQSLELGDVWSRIRGAEHPVGHILFIKNGRLSMLEGYLVADEKWPEKVEILDVSYINDKPRDQEQLLRKLIYRFAASVKVKGGEPKVKHYYGLPPEVNDGFDNRIALPRARTLLLQQEVDGFFLYRLDANGQRITDTWHQTFEDAKHQAKFEYEDALGAWMKVPEPINNLTEYVITAESMRSVFNKIDPMGIFFGHNVDEYDPEIFDLLYPVANRSGFADRDDTRLRLKRIFEKWFGADMIPKEETLTKLADAIAESFAQYKKILVDKYANKILGVQNYKSAKKGEFFVSDLLSVDTLIYFLIEVFTGESDITPAGKSFLEKYYGWDAVARMLLQSPEYLRSYLLHSFEEVQSRLVDLEPMEVRKFIEEARGNIKPGAPLKRDLLPPDEE